MFALHEKIFPDRAQIFETRADFFNLAVKVRNFYKFEKTSMSFVETKHPETTFSERFQKKLFLFRRFLLYAHLSFVWWVPNLEYNSL